MKTRIPADESTQKQRGLLLLLGLVVAGSSWQIASRTGLAAPEGRWRHEPVPIVSRSRGPSISSADVDFASRLGLARPGAQSRGPAGAWMQKPAGRTPRPATASLSASTVSTPAASAQLLADVEITSRRKEDSPVAAVPTPARRDTDAGGPEVVRPIGASTEGGWSALQSYRPRPTGESTPIPPDDDEGDPEDEDAEMFEEAEQPVSAVAQMVVLGPAVTPKGDVVTYAISLENARDVAHAPLRLVYDPQVLELVSIQEGGFLSSDGSATQFLAREGSAPGILDISISKISSLRGTDGNGILCTVTFLARTAGSSPVVIAGSRLLDPSGRKLEFIRTDSDISVN